MLGRKPDKSLREHENWKLRYSTDTDDIVEEFYTPALASAKFYDRAVGYFRLSALSVIGEALLPFWENGERMRIVCSQDLKYEDLPLLKAAHEGDRKSRNEFFENTIGKEIIFNPRFKDSLGLLTALIECGVLELFIAIGRNTPHEACLYHEKIGVIRDHRNDFLTFEGSPNETGPALAGTKGNIESFPVHKSWEPSQRPHALAARQAVDDLFISNGTRNVEVVPFPELLTEQFFDNYQPLPPKSGRKRRPKARRKIHSPDTNTDQTGDVMTYDMPQLPDYIALHDYQEEAVSAWQEKNGRGRFEMATGTGKTITAIAAAIRALEATLEDSAKLMIVVLVPDKTLVRQWHDELTSFNFRNCITSEDSEWRAKVRSELRQLELLDTIQFSVLVSTISAAYYGNVSIIDTFVEEKKSNPKLKFLFIADEAHEFGAPKSKQTLIEEFDYRLALSATLENIYDPERTKELHKYFEGSITEITLKDAIQKYQTLVPYRYEPIIVELSPEEAEHYEKLSNRISQLYAQGNHESLLDFEEQAEQLLRLRAAILKHAEGKIEKFQELLSGLTQNDRKNMLIFTAEGTRPQSADEAQLHDDDDIEHDGVRQDTCAINVLDNLKIKYEKYNGDSSNQRREYVESELEEGKIDALVSMRCLDQGVDIPEARVGIFLASSRNPRQYIQRRGRILRQPKNPKSKKTDAVIYDFITRPPLPPGVQPTEIERKLVGREILRARELANAASNKAQAELELFDIIQQYRLMDLVEGMQI